MSREAFEKAMTANVVMPRHHLVPYLSTMFDRHPTGEYIQGWVDSAWIGWQAATSAQEARVRELECAIAGLLISAKSCAPCEYMHEQAVKNARQALSTTAPNNHHDWRLQGSPGVWESYYKCSKCGLTVQENNDGPTKPTTGCYTGPGSLSAVEVLGE